VRTPSLRFVVLVLAVAAGASVGNLWILQPVMPMVARAFAISPRAVGAVSMLTQVGYGLGMFLFVPLGDVVERRGLMLVFVAAVAATLVGVAAAPSAAVLAVASLLVGAANMVPQMAVPLAAHLAPAEARGRAVGTVMGGLLVGILLARTAAGFIGAHLGWRAVYVVAAALMVALGVALRVLLPRSPPQVTLPYPTLLHSMFSLAREDRVLREAAALGACAFAAFTAFWSTLAFHLEASFGLGADAAGLFGLLGAGGALAAPLLGRLADRTSARANAGIALAVALAGWLVFCALGMRLWGLVAGVLLLDVGVQSTHVSNLARVHGRRPEARGRMNTVYMVSYFAGGALGTAVGAWAWTAFRWTGVCAVGVGSVALGLAVWWRGRGRAEVRTVK
jgi:predicted MFS family arabinose efflux permease